MYTAIVARFKGEDHLYFSLVFIYKGKNACITRGNTPRNCRKDEIPLQIVSEGVKGFIVSGLFSESE